MSCALSSGGIGAPYLIIRSRVSDQPWGPKRCCTAISTLWQITHRMTSSQPGVRGMSTSWANATAPVARTRAIARTVLRHIDLDGVDHVPAIPEPVEGSAGRLHAAEAVGGACHDRVGARAGVPVVLELPPRVAVPRAGEPARRPRLAAVGGDVDASQLALARPCPTPDGRAPGRQLRAL